MVEAPRRRAVAPREPGAPQRGDRRLAVTRQSSLPPPRARRGSRPASEQRLVVRVVRRQRLRRPAATSRRRPARPGAAPAASRAAPGSATARAGARTPTARGRTCRRRTAAGRRAPGGSGSAPRSAAGSALARALGDLEHPRRRVDAVDLAPAASAGPRRPPWRPVPQPTSRSRRAPPATSRSTSSSSASVRGRWTGDHHAGVALGDPVVARLLVGHRRILPRSCRTCAPGRAPARDHDRAASPTRLRSGRRPAWPSPGGPACPESPPAGSCSSRSASASLVDVLVPGNAAGVNAVVVMAALLVRGRRRGRPRRPATDGPRRRVAARRGARARGDGRDPRRRLARRRRTCCSPPRSPPAPSPCLAGARITRGLVPRGPRRRGRRRGGGRSSGRSRWSRPQRRPRRDASSRAAAGDGRRRDPRPPPPVARPVVRGPAHRGRRSCSLFALLFASADAVFAGLARTPSTGTSISTSRASSTGRVGVASWRGRGRGSSPWPPRPLLGLVARRRRRCRTAGARRSGDGPPPPPWWRRSLGAASAAELAPAAARSGTVEAATVLVARRRAVRRVRRPPARLPVRRARHARRRRPDLRRLRPARVLRARRGRRARRDAGRRARPRRARSRGRGAARRVAGAARRSRPSSCCRRSSASACTRTPTAGPSCGSSCWWRSCGSASRSRPTAWLLLARTHPLDAPRARDPGPRRPSPG